VPRGRLAQGRDRLALKALVGVHAVLEHEEGALAGEVDDALAPLGRQRAPRRVLAGGLQGAELDLVAGQHLLERGRVEAVGGEGDADDARAGPAQRGDEAGEGGRLHDGDVAGREHGAADEVEGLARARGHEDLVGVRRPPLRATHMGKLLAQGGETLDGAVGERSGPLLAKGPRGDLRDLLPRVQARRGPARGERDQLAVGGVAEGVLHHLARIGPGALGQGEELPVVPALLLERRRQAAHEGAAPDLGGHVAQLGQAAIGPRGREVVDPCVGRERSGGGQLRARRELAGLDRAHEEVDELAGEGHLAAPV
jgi:hypothetical protein